MGLKMEEVEVKWIHAVQVWWSWLWRTMIFVLPVSFLVGMLAGVIMAALNLDLQKNAYLLQIVGAGIGIFFSIRVMRKILNKSFNGYRIALIKVDSSTETDA